MAKKTKKGKKPRKGLSVKTYSGLNKKRYTQKGGGGNRVMFKEGETVPLQFLQEPDTFREYDMHSFQEGPKQFVSVPCAGDDCPLCDDDDDDISKTSYQFVCNVYNLKERKVQVCRGGKDLAGKIMLRYERKPDRFLKRVFDVTAMPGNFRTYDVAVAEEAPVKTSNLKLIDLDEWLVKQAQEYYGDDRKIEVESADNGRDDDDDDDDEEDDEPEHTAESLKSKKIGELREIADELEVEHEGLGKSELRDAILEALEDDEDEDDEDDEDDDDDIDDDDDDDDEDDEDEDDEEDEDDDEDEDDEDDEPPAKPKKSAKSAKKPASKKSPAKKKAAPAKKAAKKKGK
jgi:hypothetical protein